MRGKAGVPSTESSNLGLDTSFEVSENGDIEKIDSIIDRSDCKRSSLLSILLDIQAEYNYLPKDALVHVAIRLKMPLSRVYSIASFYKAYSLKPRGKHIITVCVGTACHVRGGARIAKAVSAKLDVEPGETTEDKNFTLETVNCLGACALGPVVVVDEEYHGNMTASKVGSLVKKYQCEDGGSENGEN